MSNDDLYDYYGVPIRTRQDEECTEIMENVLRADEFASISDKDKSLLEEFAPKLFNTAKYSDFVVEGMMRILCSDVRGYREGNGSFKFIEKKGVMLKNQDSKEREKSLIKHATSILKILGDPSKDDIQYMTENYKVFMGLKKMIDNPKDFFSMKIKYTAKTKTKIKNMLQELQLPKKAKIIDDFIEELQE